ncbi:MAG TPA: MerR family transcriptional regulator [Pyrinomonadaceae bacterium]
MQTTTEELFQARDFAARAGVTVRTLHHYDRLGLLKPARRTAAGYRLYSTRDFARLQQIVTLKFIGLPLKRIKELLAGQQFNLATTLRLQREILAEQRTRIERALQAIGQAEWVLQQRGAPDWETFKTILEVMTVSDMDWTKKYYSPDAQQKIDERAQTIPREVIEQGQRDWGVLIKECEQAVAEGVDPASARAQGLAARWSELIKGFTGGDPEIQRGLNQMYADKANWPAAFPRPYGDDVQAFITQAMTVRKQQRQ